MTTESALGGATLACLAVAVAAFLLAASALRTYAGGGWLPMLALALGLYTLGNLMMVPLMRASGMAVAVSVAAVLQLVLANVVGLTVFGERPGPYQVAGIVLGILAVALILWAPGGRGG